MVSHDREVNVIDYEQLSIVEEAESHGGDGHDGIFLELLIIITWFGDTVTV